MNEMVSLRRLEKKVKNKILPDLPVGSLGWSAGEYESAAPPESFSVGPIPPRPPGPSDAEPGVAAAPRSPSPPHPVSPADIKPKRRQGGNKHVFMCSFTGKPL